jgi:hypothetical protein
LSIGFTCKIFGRHRFPVAQSARLGRRNGQPQ